MRGQRNRAGARRLVASLVLIASFACGQESTTVVIAPTADPQTLVLAELASSGDVDISVFEYTGGPHRVAVEDGVETYFIAFFAETAAELQIPIGSPVRTVSEGIELPDPMEAFAVDAASGDVEPFDDMVLPAPMGDARFADDCPRFTFIEQPPLFEANLAALLSPGPDVAWAVDAGGVVFELRDGSARELFAGGTDFVLEAALDHVGGLYLTTGFDQQERIIHVNLTNGSTTALKPRPQRDTAARWLAVSESDPRTVFALGEDSNLAVYEGEEWTTIYPGVADAYLGQAEILWIDENEQYAIVTRPSGDQITGLRITNGDWAPDAPDTLRRLTAAGLVGQRRVAVASSAGLFFVHERGGWRELGLGDIAGRPDQIFEFRGRPTYFSHVGAVVSDHPTRDLCAADHHPGNYQFVAPTTTGIWLGSTAPDNPQLAFLQLRDPE